MSVKVMSLVWEHSRQTEGSLLLLLAIADCANHEGVAWPSVASLAAKTRLSERAVYYSLKKLVESGELVVIQRARQHQATVYRIAIDSDSRGAMVAPLRDEAVAPLEQSSPAKSAPLSPAITAPLKNSRGAIDDIPGVQLGASHLKELNQPSIEPSVNPPTPLEGESPTQKPKRKTRMPVDFDLSPERLAYARSKGMCDADAAALLEDMRGWSAARGGTYEDWDAAWQNWVRRHVREQEQRANTGRASPRSITANHAGEDRAYLERGLKPPWGSAQGGIDSL